MSQKRQPAKNILLIDDNSDDFQILRRCINTLTLPYRVELIHIDDGEHARQYINSINPSDAVKTAMIILDEHFPCVRGLELLKRIRSNSLLKHTPVIVNTDNHSERLLSDLYSAGANSVVYKPDSFLDYNRKLKSLVEFWIDFNLPAPVIFFR